MTAPDDVLRALRLLPPDSLVPVGWVVEHLDPEGDTDDPAPTIDWTVSRAAEETGKAESTIRSWAPEIPGAYRRNGAEWRIPPDGLRDYMRGQATTPAPDTSERVALRGGEPGDWRRAS